MGFMQGKSANEIGSELAEGVELSGNFYFSKGVRICGIVKGTIRADAVLEVGPSGRVEAEAEVRKISIQGEFSGIIRASERVEIHKEGKVRGEIFSPCLIIESGAFFEGQCNMGDKPAQPAPAALPPPPDETSNNNKKGKNKNEFLKLS